MFAVMMLARERGYVFHEQINVARLEGHCWSQVLTMLVEQPVVLPTKPARGKRR